MHFDAPSIGIVVFNLFCEHVLRAVKESWEKLEFVNNLVIHCIVNCKVMAKAKIMALHYEMQNECISICFVIIVQFATVHQRIRRTRRE